MPHVKSLVEIKPDISAAFLKNFILNSSCSYRSPIHCGRCVFKSEISFCTMKSIRALSSQGSHVNSAGNESLASEL